VYLIDTMVLSELRRRQRDAGVVAWIAEQCQEDCVVQACF
jgi:predicted nucleic acid-binding protein